MVFSAYAEVFLNTYIFGTLDGGFLRVRGGVSLYMECRRQYGRFSPRTRRCFSSSDCHALASCVFSAYAEVFLLKALRYFFAHCFLRVRGGVSI